MGGLCPWLKEKTYCPHRRDECDEMRKKGISCVHAEAAVALAVVCAMRDLKVKDVIAEFAPKRRA
jgi:hypothetical protein